jgi:hypothetical protein
MHHLRQNRLTWSAQLSVNRRYVDSAHQQLLDEVKAGAAAKAERHF